MIGLRLGLKDGYRNIMTKKKPSKPEPICVSTPFKLGALVCCLDKARTAGTYQIWGMSVAYRCRICRFEIIYYCRKIDHDTGLLYVCLDKRCSDAGHYSPGGCPICSRNFWTDELAALTKYDARFFVANGMLHQDLLKFAKGR